MISFTPGLTMIAWGPIGITAPEDAGEDARRGSTWDETGGKSRCIENAGMTPVAPFCPAAEGI
ncbi:hypothetical protein ACSTHX_00370, partial [Vibrio parahaemolyticus]